MAFADCRASGFSSFQQGAFLHRDWLATYAMAVPAAAQAYIDAHRNCEDIAMAFVVASASGAPPLYHRAPRLQDLGQGLRKVHLPWWLT